MKIAVIAAGGRLGGKIVTEALDRGHQVTAIVNRTPCRDDRAESMQKSLFDLEREDVAGFDAVISAYGSGFGGDAEINRRAMNQLAGLVRDTDTRLISIAGAGILYTDESKSTRVYELPSHPDFLKDISRNTALGVEDVTKTPGVRYTFVTPGVVFDAEGPRTGDYLAVTTRCVAQNEDGNSYTSYDDLAGAMLDFAEKGLYECEIVTVVSRNGGAI